MYDIIFHSKFKEKCMKNNTKMINKERLAATIDKLTEINQQRFLGVLEALIFAQRSAKQADTAEVVGKDGRHKLMPGRRL
jgi:hypothetical protein